MGRNVFSRGVQIGVLLILEIGLLLGVGFSATGDTDYEAVVVQQGQTLADLAIKFGLPVQALAQFNHIAATDPLRAGQVICVPHVPGGTDPQAQAQTQAPELPGATTAAAAVTPAGNQVLGVIGTVNRNTSILNQQGMVIFEKVVPGTQVLVIGEAGSNDLVLMSDGSTGMISKAVVVLSDQRMMVNRPTPPTPPPASLGRQDIVETAFGYMGVPYKYGGRLPDNVDCSLLVQTVFAKYDIRLPRTAAQQYTVGNPVEVEQLLPGDRLSFYNSSGVIGHTGIYIGDGRFIHASSNRGYVGVDELANKTYWRKFAGARRDQ